MKKVFKKMIAVLLSLSMIITMNTNALAAANMQDTNTVQSSENSVVQAPVSGKIMMLKLNEEQAYLNGAMIPTLVYGSGYVSKLILINGSTFLPLRFVCQCLGFEVGYNEQTGNSAITDIEHGVRYELVTGTTEMYKYDLAGNLLATGTATAPTTIIEGVTHVPVRSLLEAMGFRVYWNEAGYVLISENPVTQEQFQDLIDSWGETSIEHPDYNTYTVFSKNSEKDINIYGSTTSIKGDVYSGRNFNYNGASLNIDGKADAAGTNNINGNEVTAAAFNDGVSPLNMPQWGESILKLAEPITQYQGNQEFGTGQMNLEQSMRGSGNLKFNGTRFTGQGYVIANDNIEYTLSALNNNDKYKLAMYSENGDIIINGSDAVVNGILYAPNGKVIFNGSSLTVNGRIFADSIELNGSIFNFIGVPDDWDLIAGGVEKTWTSDVDFLEGSLNNVSQSRADMLTLSQKTVTGDEGYTKEYVKAQAEEGIKVKEISDTSFLTASGKDINLSFELSGFGDAENRENPIDFVLLIDVSGSMEGTKIDTAKSSAISVIDKMGENDRCAVVTFADNAVFVQSLSSDKQLLKDKINSIAVGGGTYIAPGITNAVKHLVEANSSRSKYIFILSDGEDSFNQVDQIKEASTSALMNNIRVFTLAIEKSNRHMQMVALNSRGIYRLAPSENDIAEIMDMFAAEVFDTAGRSIVFKTTIEDRSLINTDSIVPAPQKIRENSDGSVTLEWKISRLSMTDTQTISLPLAYSGEEQGVKDIIRDTSCVYYDNTGNASVLYGEDLTLNIDKYHAQGTWSAIFDGKTHGIRWKNIYWNGLRPDDGKIEVTASCSNDGENFGEPVPVTNNVNLQGLTGRYIKISAVLRASSTGKTPELYDVTVKSEGCDVPQNGSAAPFVKIRSKGTARIGVPLNLRAEITDECSGNNLSISWTSEDNTAVFENTSGINTSVTFSQPGTYEVTCTVNDGLLTNSTAAQIEITEGDIYSNLDPDARIPSPAPKTRTELPKTVGFEQKVTGQIELLNDADVSWYGMLLSDGTVATVQRDGSFAFVTGSSAKLVTVSVYAFNWDGDYTVEEYTISVTNNQPSLEVNVPQAKVGQGSPPPYFEVVTVLPNYIKAGTYKYTLNGRELLATQITQNKYYLPTDKAGDYTFRVTAEAQNGKILSAEKTISVCPIEISVELNSETDTYHIGDSVTAKVNVLYSSGNYTVTLTANGNEITVNSLGEGIFTAAAVGRYELTAEVTDDYGNSDSKTVAIKVIDPDNMLIPQVTITSPSIDDEIYEPADITGTVTSEGLLYYVLEYSPAGKDEYQTLSEGKTAVNNAFLGKIDPTVLQNGRYDIRLTGYGSNGSSSDIVTVTVEGEMKIGNYSISFVDTEVPLLNLPLTVTRTYDSRMKNTSGDFGYGWEMSLTDSLKLEENRVQGDGWTLVTQPGLFNLYYVTETKSHTIKVRWGNGRVDEFEMTIPDDITPFPTWDFNVAYKAKPGTASKLEPLGITEKYYLDSTNGLRTMGGKLYSPQRYRLTTEDGTEYIFDKDKGVEEISDSKGNTVKITENGVIHSAGDGLTFERDAENRITKITSIAGEVTYSYNYNGDLISVTDLAGYTTRFEYNRNHYLTGIIDPRGVSVSRNEYDEDGRLIAVIDADGNRIEYNHDLDDRKEIVKDRMGNTTVYGYDEQGNVISVTDPEGNTTLNTYDENGNLSSVTDPLGGVTEYEYSADGKINEITAPDGREAKSTYDQKGRLLTLSSGNPESGDSIVSLAMSYTSFGAPEKITDAEGSETSYMYNAEGDLSSVSDEIGKYLSVTYDSQGNVISTKNGEGETAIFTYDSKNRCISKSLTRINGGARELITESYVYDNAGRVVKVINGAGNTTSVEYNAIGKTSATVDERGSRTTYEYDNAGNTTKITYSDNTFETFEYDKEGRTTKAVNRSGRTITMAYDKNGNLLTKTYPNGAAETYTYDAKQRPITVTSANGGVTTYEYDSMDRNTAIVDALNNRTQFVYDPDTAALSQVIDANGNSVSYEYDKNGRQTKIILADGSAWCTEYDARGRATVQKDAYGSETVYTYDDADRLTGVTDALGNTYTYAYDGVGSLISVTDPKGYVTSYQYDRMGRATRAHIQDAVTYNDAWRRYDAAGNITEDRSQGNTQINYTYDSMNRVTRKSYGSGTSAYTATYTYTDDGLLSTVTDNSGTITYTYDEMNGLTGKTLQDGTRLAYTYDTACRLTNVSVHKPDNTLYGSTSYEYDLLDRPVKVTDKNGAVTRYEYDAAGSRTAMIYPNGAKTQYTYDNVNRLTCEKVLDKNGNTVAQYTYTLGLNGERLKVEETGRTVEYTYDIIGRLTGEKETKGSEVTTTLYEYDANSNRSKKTVNGVETTYTYGSKNQLERETGGSNVTYSYNYMENQTKKTQGSTVLNYTYDTENRLIRVTNASNANIEEYAYDWAGNRIRKTSESGTVNYIVDTNCPYAQVLAETDENGNLITWYTRGDELISLERTGEKRYYFYDGHGSTRMLTDENGNITDTYTYDAFGNPTAKTGTTENAYLYCGEQFDALTGLYYLRARYMDPASGRFTTMDSYAGCLNDPLSLHRYLYANSNPVTFKDPSGNMAVLGVALTVISSIGLAAGILSSGIHAQRYADSGATPEQMMQLYLRSIYNMILITGFCLILSTNVYAAAAFAAVGLTMQIDYIIDCFSNGDYVMGALGIAELAGMFSSIFQSCFTGDTLVATEDGNKRIDEIEVGDKVWAYNPETGETALKEVVRVYEKETDVVLHLQTTDGNIDTTTTHPFYVVGEGWRAAGDLKVGAKIYALDGTTITITAVRLEKLNKPIKVYNLEVADFHTYFVGNTGMLVHNNGCGDMDLDGGNPKNPNNQINFSKSAERQMKKLSPEAKRGFDKAIEGLKSGDTRGLNEHALTGQRSGQWAVDIKGTGKGRGAGRIIYEKGSNGQINVVEIITDHRY